MKQYWFYSWEVHNNEKFSSFYSGVSSLGHPFEKIEFFNKLQAGNLKYILLFYKEISKEEYDLYSNSQ